MSHVYIRLIIEFFQTGLFAFGGGLATLPFLQKMADTTGWFTRTDLANMIAVSESTPGPIGINMATYTGYTILGIPGGIVATLSIITPSIIVILIVSKFLDRFKNNIYVQNTFYGLRPASTGLIAAAGFQVVLITFINTDTYNLTGSFLDLLNWKSLILAGTLLIATRKIKLHPIIYIAVSAAAGIVFQFAGV